MLRHTRTILAPAALALTLIVGGSLAGCSTGSSSGSTPDATQSATSASLPADFPKSDVPLLDGDILTASGNAATGWSVTVVPSVKGGVAAAVKLLTKAGYTTSSSKPSSAYVSGPKYDVLLSSPGTTVTYAISPVQ